MSHPSLTMTSRPATPTSDDVRLNLAAKLSKYLCLALPRKKAKLSMLKSLFPQSSPIDECLEIGTGHGGLTHFLAKAGKWTYVEPVETRLTIAKKLLKGEFVCGNAFELLRDLEGERFSLIVAIDSLEHFEDVRTTLKLIYTRLKPGGKLLLTGVQNREDDFLFRIRRKLGFENATGYLHLLDCDTVKLMASEAGFAVESETFFCGLFTEIAQTVVDYASQGPRIGGDSFTKDLSDNIGKLKSKIMICSLLRLPTAIANLADKICPFLPRYGYMLILDKKH